jgi:hypothetical protein
MVGLARGLSPSYRREWLARDVVAGIVLSTLLVPQGMAYAELAGLPPITGLYTSILCLWPGSSPNSQFTDVTNALIYGITVSVNSVIAVCTRPRRCPGPLRWN